MTLLIDIGNVLARFCYQGLIDRVAPGSDVSVLDEVLALRDRFETGEMDIPEFTATAKSLLDFTGTDAEFHAAWCEIFTPVTEMIERLPRWKAAGHRLVLFSNINPLHHPYLVASYPELFSHFDEGVYSYIAGGMKPAAPMYRQAVEELGLDPAETLYLDDLPANLEAGRRWGFETLLIDWDNPDPHLTYLDTRGL